MLGVVIKSMLEIGFKAEEMEDIYSILAAVILIGDIVSLLVPIHLPPIHYTKVYYQGRSYNSCTN